jgi:hypothetical protein
MEQIGRLPLICWESVMDFLRPREMLMLSCACRYFALVVSHIPPSFWLKLVIPAPPPILRTKGKQIFISWLLQKCVVCHKETPVTYALCPAVKKCARCLVPWPMIAHKTAIKSYFLNRQELSTIPSLVVGNRKPRKLYLQEDINTLVDIRGSVTEVEYKRTRTQVRNTERLSRLRDQRRAKLDRLIARRLHKLNDAYPSATYCNKKCLQYIETKRNKTQMRKDKVEHIADVEIRIRILKAAKSKEVAAHLGIDVEDPKDREAFDTLERKLLMFWREDHPEEYERIKEYGIIPPRTG